MQLACPSCQRQVTLPEGNEGTKVQCPHCGRPVIVPADVVQETRPPTEANWWPQLRAFHSWPTGRRKVIFLVGAVGTALCLAGTFVVILAMGSKQGSVVDKTTPNSSPVSTASDSRFRPEQVGTKDKPLLVFDTEGHTAGVMHVFLTPDAKRAITLSVDKTVRIWDITTGESLHVIRLPIPRIDSGKFESTDLSVDGKTLVVAGMNEAGQPTPIYFLSTDPPQVLRVLSGPATHVRVVKLSTDGKFLAVGGKDNMARVYEIATGQCTCELSGHSKEVWALAFSPDGQRLLSAALDGSARMWSLADRKQVTEFSFAVAPPTRPGELPHEGLLAKGQNFSPQVACLAWSPDGRTIAMGGTTGYLRTYDSAGKYIRSFSISPAVSLATGIPVTSVSFSRDSRKLLATGVSGFGRGLAAMIDMVNNASRPVFERHNNVILAGGLSADGTLAITTGSADAETYIWRTSDGVLVQELQGRGKAITAVSWSRDGKRIAVGHSPTSGPANLRALEHSLRLDTLERDDAIVPQDYPKNYGVRGFNSTYNFQIAHEGLYRHRRDGKNPPVIPVFKLEGADDRIHAATVIDERHVAVGAMNGLYLVDIESLKVVRKFRGHAGLVQCLSPSPDGRYFLSGSADQTVRVWVADREEPLLSMLTAGADWIAWTPQGYYAASPGGERLMGWQTNNGTQALASYHPAAQFRKSLYRPDVIKLVLTAGSVEKAVELAEKERRQATTIVNVEQVRPPLVAITHPPGPSGYRAPGTKLEVKAVATSVGQHPVTALRLLVDGRPYGGAQGRNAIAAPRLGDVTVTWNVDLAPGKHVLTVQAESAVSKGLSPFVEMTSTASAAEQPSLYVLAVGINEYPGDLRLQYAASDADAITKALQDRGSRVFRKVEVNLVKDRQATRQGIESGLEWLKARMTSKDVGVLFFSGHGDRVGENFYLIPVNGNPNDVPGSCISGELIKRTLGDMPGRLITVLDACHSGAAINAQRGPASADDLIRDLVSDDYGIVVLSSSLGREFSLEGAEVKQGYFTLALVEGLSGRADRNRDGLVYLNELDSYATRRVPELSRGKQHPIVSRPSSIPSFPLSRN